MYPCSLFLMVIDSKCSGVVHVFTKFFRVCTFKYQFECQAEYSRLILQLRNAKLGPTDQFLMTQLWVHFWLILARLTSYLEIQKSKKTLYYAYVEWQSQMVLETLFHVRTIENDLP